MLKRELRKPYWEGRTAPSTEPWHLTPLGLWITEITVRLPGELVEFIDRLVSEGRATSRVAVTQALQRERRRHIAARDATILASAGGEEQGLNSLAEHSVQLALDDLDQLVPLQALNSHWAPTSLFLERLMSAQADPGLRHDVRALTSDTDEPGQAL